MIFLTLFAVGAVAAWLVGWLRGAYSREGVAYGAGGAFLLGGLAAGLAERPLGAFDPLVLAIGAVGAVGAALLGDALERGANDMAAADHEEEEEGGSGRPADRSMTDSRFSARRR